MNFHKIKNNLKDNLDVKRFYFSEGGGGDLTRKVSGKEFNKEIKIEIKNVRKLEKNIFIYKIKLWPNTFIFANNQNLFEDI